MTSAFLRPGVLGAVCVFAAAVLWGLLGIFGTYAQRAGMSPYDVAWWRAFIGSVMFAVHARVVGAPLPRGRDLVVTALFGLVSGAVFYGAYQVAVASGGASLASVLLYTAPAFVAVLSVPVLRERLGGIEIGAVVASIVGVGMVASGGGGGVVVSWLSLGAGLLAGFTYSLYYLYGRAFYQRYHPSACLGVALAVATVALTPVTSSQAWDPLVLSRSWGGDRGGRRAQYLSRLPVSQCGVDPPAGHPGVRRGHRGAGRRRRSRVCALRGEAEVARRAGGRGGGRGGGISGAGPASPMRAVRGMLEA